MIASQGTPDRVRRPHFGRSTTPPSPDFRFMWIVSWHRLCRTAKAWWASLLHSMRLSRDQLVEGLPAEQARELMRIFRREPGLTEDATKFLGLDEAHTAEVLERFAKTGYLEVVRRDRDGTWWFTTIQGNALANASFAKPITRATAQRHLDGFLERVRTYNADHVKPYTVTQVTVFGSCSHTRSSGQRRQIITAALRRSACCSRVSPGSRARARARSWSRSASVRWSAGGLVRRRVIGRKVGRMEVRPGREIATHRGDLGVSVG